MCELTKTFKSNVIIQKMLFQPNFNSLTFSLKKLNFLLYLLVISDDNDDNDSTVVEAMRLGKKKTLPVYKF